MTQQFGAAVLSASSNWENENRWRRSRTFLLPEIVCDRRHRTHTQHTQHTHTQEQHADLVRQLNRRSALNRNCTMNRFDSSVSRNLHVSPDNSREEESARHCSSNHNSKPLIYSKALICPLNFSHLELEQSEQTRQRQKQQNERMRRRAVLLSEVRLADYRRRLPTQKLARAEQRRGKLEAEASLCWNRTAEEENDGGENTKENRHVIPLKPYYFHDELALQCDQNAMRGGETDLHRIGFIPSVLIEEFCRGVEQRREQLEREQEKRKQEEEQNEEQEMSEQQKGEQEKGEQEKGEQEEEEQKQQKGEQEEEGEELDEEEFEEALPNEEETRQPVMLEEEAAKITDNKDEIKADEQNNKKRKKKSKEVKEKSKANKKRLASPARKKSGEDDNQQNQKQNADSVANSVSSLAAEQKKSVADKLEALERSKMKFIRGEEENASGEEEDGLPGEIDPNIVSDAHKQENSQSSTMPEENLQAAAAAGEEAASRIEPPDYICPSSPSKSVEYEIRAWLHRHFGDLPMQLVEHRFNQNFFYIVRHLADPLHQKLLLLDKF